MIVFIDHPDLSRQASTIMLRNAALSVAHSRSAKLMTIGPDNTKQVLVVPKFLELLLTHLGDWPSVLTNLKTMDPSTCDQLRTISSLWSLDDAALEQGPLTSYIFVKRGSGSVSHAAFVAAIEQTTLNLRTNGSTNQSGPDTVSISLDEGDVVIVGRGVVVCD